MRTMLPKLEQVGPVHDDWRVSLCWNLAIMFMLCEAEVVMSDMVATVSRVIVPHARLVSQSVEIGMGV